MVDIPKQVVCNQIVFTVVSIIAMIIAIVAYASASNNPKILQNITNNHQTKPARNIETNYGCSYDDLFSKAKFEGTSDGCDCTTSYNFFYDDVYSRTCGKSDRRNGCYTVYGLPSENLADWKGIRSLCLSKTIDYNYYNLIDENLLTSTECKDGFKECGFADSLKNKLCYPSSKSCPINDVYVTKSKDDPVNPSYNQIKFNTDQKLLFTNTKTSGDILVQTDISEGAMCAYPSEYNGNKLEYILDSSLYTRVSQCSNLPNSTTNKNYFYRLIDSYNKYEAYHSNNIFNTLNRLPKYPFNSLRSSEYKIYGRSYVGWKTSCFKDESTHPRVLLDYYNEANKYSVYQLNVMILSIIVLVAACCGFCLLGLEYKGFYYIYNVGTFLFYLTCFVLCFFIKSKSVSTSIIDCTDEIAGKLLEKYNNDLGNNGWAIGVLEGFFIVGMLLQLYNFYLIRKEPEPTSYVTDGNELGGNQNPIINQTVSEELIVDPYKNTQTSNNIDGNFNNPYNNYQQQYPPNNIINNNQGELIIGNVNNTQPQYVNNNWNVQPNYNPNYNPNSNIANSNNFSNNFNNSNFSQPGYENPDNQFNNNFAYVNNSNNVNNVDNTNFSRNFVPVVNNNINNNNSNPQFNNFNNFETNHQLPTIDDLNNQNNQNNTKYT